MASLGDLILKIGANFDSFDAAMGGISSKLRAAERSAEKEFSGFAALGSQLTSMGTTLSLALTAPIVGAGAAAVKMASDFELAMREVNSLLGTDATEKSFQRLSDQALDLSRRMGIDAVAGAKSLYEVLSANIPQENAISFLEVATKGAIAGMADTKVAVDGLTTTINAFHLGVGEAGAVMDAMIKGVVIGKYHLEELAAAIGSAASSADQMGVSYNDLIAAGTTITRQGITISVAMDQIAMAMKSITAPNKVMNGLIKETGYESGRALVAAKGFEGALAAIRDAAKDNDAVLFHSMGRIEGYRALLELTGKNAKVAAEDLEAIRNPAGSVEAAFAQIDKSTARQFQRLITDLKDTAIQLGTALLPAVNDVLGAVKPFVAEISHAVTLFQSLPAPVRGAIEGFVALAAVIGPIALVLGTMISSFATIGTAVTTVAGVIGISTAAFAGWAVGIAAAVTALAALGVWVYEHWDNIKAVVTQAWAGVQEAWQGVWTSITGFMSGVWEGIGSTGRAVIGVYVDYLKGVWSVLQTVWKAAWDVLVTVVVGPLKSIWDAVKDVFGNIVDQFKVFLQWAEKFPGVNKLMNLDVAWASVKKLETGTKDATVAVAAHAKAHEDGKPKVEAHTGAVKSAGVQVDDYAKKVKEWNLGSELWKLRINDIEKAYRDQVKEIYAAQEALAHWPQTMAEVDAAQKSLTESLKKYGEASADVSKIKIPASIAATDASKQSVYGLDQALKDLGITSTTQYEKVAEEADKAFDAIMGSGVATTWEKDNAMLKMLKAQADAMKANGQQIPADMQKMIDDLNAKVNDKSNGLGKVNDSFKQMGEAIKYSVGGAFDDLVTKLVTGKGSFTEIMTKMWQDIATAVADYFLKPIKDAAADLISGAIKDLLGGNGFGGIWDTLKGIGSTIKDVFTGGSGAADAAGSVAGSTGSAGSAAGSAGSAAAGGVASVVSAVSGVVSAITGVIGIFQNAHQETTLNAIEHSTRYSNIFLGEQSQSILWSTQTTAERLNYVNASLDTVKQHLENWLSPLRNVIENGQSIMNSMLGQLGDISSHTYWSLAQLQQSQNTLLAIADSIRGSALPASVTVNVTTPTDASPDLIGYAVANQLRLRGAI